MTPSASYYSPDYNGVEWERALAAAEVVAVMKGHPAVKRASTHEQIIQLVRKESLVPTQALVDKALLVCDLTLSDSEIKDRTAKYSRPEFYEAWTRAVMDLKRRLKKTPDA